MEYQNDGERMKVVDFLDSFGCEAVSEVETSKGGYSIVYGLNDDGVGVCRLVVEKKKEMTLEQIVNADCLAHVDERFAIVLTGFEKKVSEEKRRSIKDLLKGKK